MGKIPKNFIDLSGKRFGRLTVLHRDLEKKLKIKWKAYWICKCDCGNIKSIIFKSSKFI